MFEEIEEQLKVTADRVAHLRKFLDVPKAQNRLTEIEGEMSQDNFWDNRNYAQKLVDESSARVSTTPPQIQELIELIGPWILQ